MKENSSSILEIESLAVGGDGVGKLNGKVTFVPRSAPGDKVRVNVISEKKKMQRAKVVEILEEGFDRRAAICPLFGECGGCQWMHIEEVAQRKAKRSFLKKALGIEVPDIIASPKSIGYRRLARLRLGAAPKKILGFNAGASSQIVDVPRCEVLEPSLNQCLAQLRTNLIPHCNRPAEIRLTGGDLNVAVSLSAQAMFEPNFYQVAQSLVPKIFSGITTDVDKLFAVVAGSADVIVEGIDKAPLITPAGSFGQANSDVNKMMGELICDWVKDGDFRSAIELFAGAGNLTVLLAGLVKKLAAVELDDRAVKASRRNIAFRKLRGVTVYQADALEAYEKLGAKMDLLIMDPPRTGHAELAARIAKARHRAVIYVSCNPSTLGRDLEIMATGGYKPVKVRGFDMFPQTPHVETVVKLERD